MFKRYLILTTWACLIGVSFYLFFFQADFVEEKLAVLFGLSLWVSGTVYLLLGCLRGFTLIPSTYLIIFGIVFLPLWPLYILTIIGILVSSLTVYFLSEQLGFDAFFEKKYSSGLKKLRASLQKNELPIVIFWSFAPFLPTDAVCYLCGTLKVNVYKFLFGVLIGEGIVCFIYIFLGENLLTLLQGYF